MKRYTKYGAAQYVRWAWRNKISAVFPAQFDSICVAAGGEWVVCIPTLCERGHIMQNPLLHFLNIICGSPD